MTLMPAPRLLALLALMLLALSACGERDSDITIVFDPCEPIALRPSSTATAAQIQSLQDAAMLWNAHGTKITVAEEPGEAAANEIPVEFEEAAPMFFGVYRDEEGDVVINDRIRDSHERAIVATHELGHAFGLEHVEEDFAQSVMMPGNIDLPPQTFDVHSLEELWPDCALNESDG